MEKRPEEVIKFLKQHKESLIKHCNAQVICFDLEDKHVISLGQRQQLGSTLSVAEANSRFYQFLHDDPAPETLKTAAKVLKEAPGTTHMNKMFAKVIEDFLSLNTTSSGTNNAKNSAYELPDKEIIESNHNLSKPWESNQIEDINKLLEKAYKIMQYFQKREETVHDHTTWEDGMNFGDFVYNLYKVLDFTWFLLYCHFCNNGEADLTSKASRSVNFPCKATGVKISENRVQDQGDKYKEDILKQILGQQFNKPENEAICKKIGDMILEMQLKNEVDGAGKPVHAEPVKPRTEKEKYLYILHYYRNCYTHRTIFQLDVLKHRFNKDPETGRIYLTPVVQQENSRQGVKAGRYFYIELPLDEESKPLFFVLQELFLFVRGTAKELIEAVDNNN